jgi:phosphoglycolate phosphatase-like HAD superfamily hydrolase
MMVLATLPAPAQSPDPLPSWIDGKAKSSIIQFITSSTLLGYPGFIAPDQRIAVFDLDGTLWAEDPIVQLLFYIRRLQQLMPDHPEWKNDPWVAQAMKADIRSIEQQWDSTFGHLCHYSLAGLPVDTFHVMVNAFLAEARHPKFKRLLKETVYLPVKELLAFLAEYGYRAFILAPGYAEFVRAFSQEVFGIPPGRIIEKLDELEGPPAVTCANARHPGDLRLLEYTQEQNPPGLRIYINHDDMSRENFYGDRDGKAAASAASYGWTTVSMRRDWKKIFSF